MHLNHYFLSQLVFELKPLITGTYLAEIFTQQKDEVVLGFGKPGEDFFIKCQTGPGIQGFSFTKEFNRAKKNSVDLFKPATGKKVLNLFSTYQDRSFGINMENGVVLFFKMHGSRSNIILYQNGNGIEEYHKSFDDILLPFESYKKPELFSIDNLITNEFKIQQLLPALGPEPLKWLESKSYSTQKEDDKIELICTMLDVLHHPESFYILNENEKAVLSFFQTSPLLVSKTSAIEIANLFQKYYFTFTLRNKFVSSETKILTAKKVKLERYISSSREKLNELSSTNTSEQIGDILMANLYNIPERSESVTLFDFYSNTNRDIKLKKDYSPQKNAENYYRKGKNLILDLKNLENIIEQKQKELDLIESSLINISDSPSNIKLPSKEKVIQQQSFPFKKFEFEGYEIRVGKSSQKNDELLQQHSHKNDLWLHARGFAGSHVIIKNIAGTLVPQNVIEKAASLAAYYSKGKTNNLCPVIVTERKYVRKAKGMAPGQVIVDKEKTIMVTPSEY
ncbi:MAG: DUF814 domain-containing protein [Opitutaceae bacterium]|nr:DUF814 domain-containing protein [Cytophagales bacterium]